MRIAVASGKGGTGKTIVATNLAQALVHRGYTVTYADCDVEAPNGHIFLRPQVTGRQVVTIPIPEVDDARCTHCGRCGEFYQFSAIVCLGNSVLTFPDLCHGCGGCALVCPERAIREVPREIGEVEEGRAGRLTVLQGRLRIGQAVSPPLIRAVKRKLPPDGIAILDAPPGAACPMIETVRGADFVLLVTEPTPFGLHDLRLAVEAVRRLGLPMGIVINRAAAGRDGIRHFCGEADLPILLEIPDERRIAVAYSRGDLAVDAVPSYREWMHVLYEGIRREAAV